jgi:hypothetical protein
MAPGIGSLKKDEQDSQRLLEVDKTPSLPSLIEVAQRYYYTLKLTILSGRIALKLQAE